jgi:ABC-type uncharacterized transport system substrate-binding protein
MAENIQLLTRTGLDWSHRYKRTIEALRSLKVKSAYLDGELCALNADGVPVFSRLQAVMDEGRTDQLLFFAFDWNANNPFTQLVIHESKSAARILNVRLQPLQVHTPADFDSAFETGNREHIDSLIVVEDPLTISRRRQIVDFAAKRRIPAVYGAKTFVDVGGFVSFGASFPDLYRRAAFYVDKILKGANPGELPIEQATKFELVINRKTAKALDLNVSDQLLAVADEVIE